MSRTMVTERAIFKYFHTRLWDYMPPFPSLHVHLNIVLSVNVDLNLDIRKPFCMHITSSSVTSPVPLSDKDFYF